MKNEPLVVERLLNAPPEKVWEALTDHTKMKHWYFDLANFQAVPGFEFEFYGGKDGRQYLHLCKVITVEAGKKLSYSWKYKDYPGESLVTFELFPEDGKTKLKLTHEGLETFATDNPDLAKENFIEGWNHIIGKTLPAYVEEAGHTVDA